MRLAYVLAATVVLQASLSTGQTAVYQSGTILDVRTKGTPSGVRKATDAPPPPMQATYEITIQAGGMVYVGQYQHVSEYVPSNWVVGQSVDMRVGKHKHRIYLKDVSGKEVALPIVSKRPAKSTQPGKQP